MSRHFSISIAPCSTIQNKNLERTGIFCPWVLGCGPWIPDQTYFSVTRLLRIGFTGRSKYSWKWKRQKNCDSGHRSQGMFLTSFDWSNFQPIRAEYYKTIKVCSHRKIKNYKPKSKRILSKSSRE